MDKINQEQAVEIFVKTVENQQDHKAHFQKMVCRQKFSTMQKELIDVVATELHKEQVANLVWFDLAGVEEMGATQKDVVAAVEGIIKKTDMFYSYEIRNNRVFASMLPYKAMQLKEQIGKFKAE